MRRISFGLSTAPIGLGGFPFGGRNLAAGRDQFGSGGRTTALAPIRRALERGINPVIYLTTTSRFTLPLGLSLFQGYDGTQWPWLMAASVVALLPCLIVFFAGQRLFVQGFATTGIKG